MRTAEDILRTMIGDLTFQNAALQAALEAAQEKILELEKAPVKEAPAA